MRRLVFDQSSPVQPISEPRGGPLSLTYIGSAAATAAGVEAGHYFSFLI